MIFCSSVHSNITSNYVREHLTNQEHWVAHARNRKSITFKSHPRSYHRAHIELGKKAQTWPTKRYSSGQGKQALFALNSGHGASITQVGRNRQQSLYRPSLENESKAAFFGLFSTRKIDSRVACSRKRLRSRRPQPQRGNFRPKKTFRRRWKIGDC
jgi:hypothetical protein